MTEKKRNLDLFLKENQSRATNAFFKATNSLKDEDGEALEWEIKPLLTSKVMKMRREASDDTNFGTHLIAEAVVFPDLMNAKLQDSYGVTSPEELVMELIPNLGEFNAFTKFIMKHSGIKEDAEEQAVKEAKN